MSPQQLGLRGPLQLVMKEIQSHNDTVEGAPQSKPTPLRFSKPWATALEDAQERGRQWKDSGSWGSAAAAVRRTERKGQESREWSPGADQPPRQGSKERGSRADFREGSVHNVG